MTSRLRFGIFLAPFHKPGINPTLALQNDLDLVAWLDRLGYDEAWFGEHHSAGTEISASPEIMIAVAAERTRHIKLGTGVVSLSYHNPLWVAERIVLLDHLTRGRVMLGAGPGSLPTNSRSLGSPSCRRWTNTSPCTRWSSPGNATSRWPAGRCAVRASTADRTGPPRSRTGNAQADRTWCRVGSAFR